VGAAAQAVSLAVEEQLSDLLVCLGQEEQKVRACVSTPAAATYTATRSSLDHFSQLPCTESEREREREREKASLRLRQLRVHPTTRQCCV
jgi:hypothetical protein